MNDTDFVTLAREAREQVVPSSPPFAAILADVRRPRPRPWRTALAAAVAVAVVTVGLAWWLGASRPAPEPAPPTDFTPPAGTRWLGVGDVAVAIPRGWAQNDLFCDRGITGSVVLDRQRWERCQRMGTFAPSVRFLQTDQRAAARYVDAADVPVEALDDLADPVFDGPAERTPALAAADGVVRMALVVPARDLVVLVEAETAAAVESIVASAAVVPDDLQAISLNPIVGGAGIRPVPGQRVRQESSEYLPGAVLGAEPPLGTPVPIGSRVVVTVSSGPASSSLDTHELSSLGGWTVTPARGATPTLSRREMQDRLRPRPDGKVIELDLRRLSVEGQDPPVVDRLVWIAVYPGLVVAPLGGKPGHEPAPDGRGTGVTAYDAATGEMLRGLTY